MGHLSETMKQTTQKKEAVLNSLPMPELFEQNRNRKNVFVDPPVVTALRLRK
jgi:hypothetical protein